MTRKDEAMATIEPGIPNNGKPVKDLRDEFAMAALPPAIDYQPRRLLDRLRALCGMNYTGANVIPREAAMKAYAIADAMLLERQKATP